MLSYQKYKNEFYEVNHSELKGIGLLCVIANIMNIIHTNANKFKFNVINV